MWLPPEAIITLTVTVLVSVGFGFLESGRLRALLIISVWLTPFWFALWWVWTIIQGEPSEYDAASILLFFTPMFLVAWAAITIFPFKLTVRLLEIHRGDDFNRS
ncbi:MAG: hypothetical protein ACKOUT_03180 [Novosphingobium sp.]